MTYRLVEYTPDLDLSVFYAEADKRRYENNNSQKAMFDCFSNEKSWAGWMLTYNNEYVGGVCIHSFNDVMGEGSYRILARTCVFTEKTHKPWPYTRKNSIVNQQCVAAQFYIPMSIKWAGPNTRLFATSNSNEMGNQRRVNNLWFPEQEKLKRFDHVKKVYYRGCEQNVWELNIDNFWKSIHDNEIWPCDFPGKDPRQ